MSSFCVFLIRFSSFCLLCLIQHNSLDFMFASSIFSDVYIKNTWTIMRFIPVRRHEIAEILLKLALKTNQLINQSFLSDKDIRNRFKMYIDPVLIKKYFKCALQEHPSSPSVLSGILVARSLAL